MGSQLYFWLSFLLALLSVKYQQSFTSFARPAHESWRALALFHPISQTFTSLPEFKEPLDDL